MKKIPILHFIFFFLSGFASAQEVNTALITNPQIGSDNGELFLTEIVEDLNSLRKIDNVVILGNITLDGNEDEFASAVKILKSLNKPYIFVGGPADYPLIESEGNKTNHLWKDNHLLSHSMYIDQIFLSTIHTSLNGKSHIPIETLSSLSSIESFGDEILVFSYFPIDGINNGYKLSNLFSGKKIISFSSIINKTKNKESLINKYSGVALATDKKWAYNILAENRDSIIVIEISAGSSDSLFVDVIEKIRLKNSEIIDSSQLITYSPNAEVLQTIHFNRTTFSPIITSIDKNYISTIDGWVARFMRNGEIRWEYNTNGLIYSSLIKEKDLIVVMTSEGDLFTINANNGDLVQVIGIGESITSDIRLIELEYNRMNTKGIVFGTANGNIYCYELYSLEMVWENYLTDRSVVSKPLAVENKIIYQTKKNYYCVNAKNGSLIWVWKKEKESEDGFFQSDLITNGRSVFYINAYGNLVSIDLLLGTEHWKIGKKLSPSGKIFKTNNTNELIIHSTKNQLLVVHQSNGKVIKRIDLPKEFKNALPTCFLETDAEKLFGFDNGLICKLDSEHNITNVLFTDSAPVISIVSLDRKEYLTNNLDGNLVYFVLH